MEELILGKFHLKYGRVAFFIWKSGFSEQCVLNVQYTEKWSIITLRSLHGKGIPRTLRSIHGRVNYQKIAFYTEQSGVSEHCVLYMEEGILRTLCSIHGRGDSQNVAFYTWKS